MIALRAPHARSRRHQGEYNILANGAFGWHIAGVRAAGVQVHGVVDAVRGDGQGHVVQAAIHGP